MCVSFTLPLMVDKHSTGIQSLDRHLDGGLAPGDTLAIISSPATQSQTLLYELMRERPTIYVTALRPTSLIKNDIETHVDTEFPYRIESIGNNTSIDSDAVQELTGSRTFTGNSALKNSPVDELYDIIESISEPKNIFIDPTNPLERGENREAYVELLNKLSIKMEETGGIGVLNCHTSEPVPPFRDETLMIVDTVWELDMVSTSKDNVEYKLLIPKNRSGEVITEELSLEFNRKSVTIDDSRSI